MDTLPVEDLSDAQATRVGQSESTKIMKRPVITAARPVKPDGMIETRSHKPVILSIGSRANRV